MTEVPTPDSTPRPIVPRGVIILLALATGVIVLFGMRAIQDILAPIFMALVLTICVYPLRIALERRGWHKWLATLVLILGVYAILLFLAGATIIGIARLGQLLPQYTDQIQQSLTGFTNFLGKLGITADQIKTVLHNITPGTFISLIGTILSGTLSVLSLFVFVVVLVLFMGIDSAAFGARAGNVGPDRRETISALAAFAIGTRKYFVVATIFGGIVAVLDTAALLIIGVPAALLWGLVAFVTNYVPNVGFIIGLIPPAVLALLTGGWEQMLAVIIVYCVLNLVIQSVLQPKFVGDAVGLTTTVSFLSLIVWAFVLGPLGAILAVPMTLLAKALMVDHDPDARWLQLFLGDEPDLSSRKQKRAAAQLAAAANGSAAPTADNAPGADAVVAADGVEPDGTDRVEPDATDRVEPGGDGPRHGRD